MVQTFSRLFFKVLHQNMLLVFLDFSAFFLIYCSTTTSCFVYCSVKFLYLKHSLDMFVPHKKIDYFKLFHIRYWKLCGLWIVSWLLVTVCFKILFWKFTSYEYSIFLNFLSQRRSKKETQLTVTQYMLCQYTFDVDQYAN